MGEPDKLPRPEENTFAPIAPPTLLKPHLPATLGLTNVVVTPNLGNPRLYNVSWQPQTGATKYIVYVSPHPITSFKNKFKDLPRTTISVEFEIPIILPHNVVFYFWVTYINPFGNEIMIGDEPSFTTNDTAFEDDQDPISEGTKRDIMHDPDAKYRIEEIRRRHLAIVENDGEDFYLYIRRFFGQPCVSLQRDSEGKVTGRSWKGSTPFLTGLGQNFNPDEVTEAEKQEAKDPNYSQHTDLRCPDCFGTGIAGGYYPKLRIRVRYGNAPLHIFKFQEQGIEFQHNFNSHTIWHPRLKERDFLVRIRTGERFTIKEPGYSSQRGIPIHQSFNAIAEAANSPIYGVTDEKIEAALDAEMSFDVAKFDWAVWR